MNDKMYVLEGEDASKVWYLVCQGDGVTEGPSVSLGDVPHSDNPVAGGAGDEGARGHVQEDPRPVALAQLEGVLDRALEGANVDAVLLQREYRSVARRHVVRTVGNLQKK